MLTIEQKATILRDNLARLCPGTPEEVDLVMLTRTGGRVVLGPQNFIRVVTDYNPRGTFYKQDSDHCFTFEFEAPGFQGTINSDGAVTLHRDLAATFLWKVLTDIGQQKRLETVDGTDAVEWMLSYVRDFYNQYGEDPYYGREAESFVGGLQDFYRYEKESRFSDGYCGAVSSFWPAACQDLFGERRVFPYRFMY